LDAVATQPASERHALFVETAARMGTASSVIAEKDFWVCFVLHRLFSLDFRPRLLFKGGTSLSKAFGLIDRFSEDVDLTLNRAELGFSGPDDPLTISGSKARQRKIEALGEACTRAVRERLEPSLRASLENVLGRQGWTLELVALEDGQVDLHFHYPPSLSPEDYGVLSYVQPVVRMEIGARSDQEPSVQALVRSYAAQHLPDVFSRLEAEVRVLSPERTFWEKATILHAESNRPLGGAGELPRAWRQLSRHAYDIVMLARRGIAERAVARLDLLAAVARHKDAFFHSAWARYGEAKPGSLRLVPGGQLAGALRRDYSEMSAMLFGQPPSFDEIVGTLGELEQQINRTG